MCDFTIDTPPAPVLDPRKRVRHFTGLVMGVEEFQQDQLYFMARDELHQRALHGYGRVAGLGVSVRPEEGSGDPKVVVAAGLAVNPRGESICVPVAQCADLNQCLEAHREELLGSPPGLLPGDATLYVVLCARDCETDAVPVLGDPCRTLEDATADSRIADDFELCLRREPPEQLEEEAVRRFGELLRAIEISDAPGGLTPEGLADLVRDLVPAGSPPEAGEVDVDLGSPPIELRLHPDDVAEALAAAFQVWITEVRPAINPATGACVPPRDRDRGRCLLLACLRFQYDEGVHGLEVTGEVEIDVSQGPILVQTRVLQELLLAGWLGTVTSPVPVPPPLPEPLASPPEVFPVSHSDLLDLDVDDHDQYLLVDPVSRALIADLDAAGHLVAGLGEPGVATGSEAVRWDRAVKNGDAAGGDLSGTYPDPQVVALQGNPVAPGALGPGAAGSLLLWDGGIWRPARLPLEADLVRIIALSWRHDGSSLLQITHDGNEAFGLVIGFGSVPGDPRPVDPATLDNHTFRVFLRRSRTQASLPIFELWELRPRAVQPVAVVQIAGGLIVETRTAGAPDEVTGAFFQLDSATANTLVQQGRELFVELAGDHVLDPTGRAIDAELPRAGLPSGDGPGAAPLGIQGGRFESWLTTGPDVGDRIVIRLGGLDLNRAGAQELDRLPRIGPVLARRIVEVREARGGFDRFEDLSEVAGVSSALLNGLRQLLES